MLYYISLFFIFLTLVFYCVKKGKKRFDLLGILGFSVLIVLGYAMTLSTENVDVMSYGHIVVFVGLDWMLFSLIVYAFKQTERKKPCQFVCPLMILLLIDTFFLLSFSYIPNVISFEPIIYNNQLYLNYTPSVFYYIHLVICYLMVLAILVLLITKGLKMPSLYRWRHLSIAVCIIVIVLLNTLFLSTDLIIDVSILGYAIAGLAIYYFTVHDIPIRLRSNILDLLVQHMYDAVIVYDYKGDSWYHNQVAVDIFTSEVATLNLEDFRREKLNDLFLHANKTVEVMFFIHQERRYFDLSFHDVQDHKNRRLALFMVIRDNTQRMLEQEKNAYLAIHDNLTDVYNRVYFMEEARKLLEANPDKKYYVVATNFEKFRIINDIFGNEFGDELLKKIAQTIKKYGTQYNFLYARMGSDKFGIFIEKSLFSEIQLTKIITNDFTLNANSIPTSLKFGVAEVEDNIAVSMIYDRAVMALHSNKENYHKKVSYYTLAEKKQIIREQELLDAFQNSLENGDFVIYYQPQVNSSNQTMIGVEALARWHHPTLGMISPKEFIPIFEKHQMIIRLDYYVWESAIQQLIKWQGTAYENISISVNISPIDLLSQDVYKIFAQFVKQYSFHPSMLKLEITESAFMGEKEVMIDMISKLQKLGFLVEMDDFGTGYSSFHTLKELPVNVLKLDMSFISGDLKNTKMLTILEAIIRMAHHLSMPVIAEGVETEEQLKILNSMSCELIQGYYFAEPMPVDQLEKYALGMQCEDILSFWLNFKSNKTMYFTLKSLHEKYDAIPFAFSIVHPLMHENEVIDLTIIYANQSFAESQNVKVEDILYHRFYEVFPYVDPLFLNRYAKIAVEGGEEKYTGSLEDGRTYVVHAYQVAEGYCGYMLQILEAESI